MSVTVNNKMGEKKYHALQYEAHFKKRSGKIFSLLACFLEI